MTVRPGHWSCPRCGEEWYLWVTYCKDCAASDDDEREHQDHIADGKATFHRCFTCVWNRVERMRRNKLASII